MEEKFFKSPNTYIGLVKIKVQDLERSIQFYQDVIGFQVFKQTKRKAHLTADGSSVLLTIEQPEFVKPLQTSATGLYHFALLVPTRKDLAKILHHLSKIGIRLGSSDHLVSEALYLSDPDGNGIEIYTDRDSEKWIWNQTGVKMAVDPIDTNDLLSELENRDWQGLPSHTKMGHIHLHVAELQNSQTFYEALGFEVVSRLGNQALFMSTGGYHHHLGLNTWKGIHAPSAPEDSAGLNAFSIIFPNKEKREIAAHQLDFLDYPVIKEPEFYRTEDPSGNKVHMLVKET
ncbi:glyoxalase [Halobacillus mangrovi]|uniref:Glyoxalase n=1 Tax=Halobacillus mangrovi TaxID=402384 RepID=A0A1W6A126_9BACI|nr:VOC family protein [Halobacillus mangrovi]ARI79207.1 glyoxalase [Halobacillus mangrovi]